MSIRRYWCAAAVAGVLCIPAVAQYSPQDQPRHDQDDRNRTTQDRDHDHDNDRANGAYGQNTQWQNTKAYRQGMKDGEHDRSKNKGERADHRHWKNDQDRQAYQAGYYQGYRGTMGSNNDRDRDHDRDHR
jgi:hypothetical protein